jgi:hypothetical protein
VHVLIGLLLAAVLVVLLYRALSSSKPAGSAAPGARSERAFAFLSNGNIFVRPRGGPVEQLHSPYVQEAIDRRERARERNSWKQGTSFRIAAGGGSRDFQPADQPILATAATYESSGDLLYFLRDETIGALFRREAESGKELRLISRTNLQLTDLAPSPDATQLAASSLQSDGIANIALLKADGSGYCEVTGGDSIDRAPAWVPGVPKRLLFQSTGVARHQGGGIVGQSNAHILKLDMDSGSVTPILDDARFDFLRPRVDPAGNLLFIRRPYRQTTYGMGNVFTDTLLFPFRLLRAIFHYLNFFSLMYSRKPLTSADNPAVQADIKQILLQGRVVDAQKALRTARAVQGVPSLVPDDWELVRRDADGNERVLATNVASYDIGADGTIVYSNGQGVFVLDGSGSARLALTDQLVNEVSAV